MQPQNIPTHRYSFSVALVSGSIGLANFALQGANEVTVSAFMIAATSTVHGIYDLNKENSFGKAVVSIANHLSSLWKSSNAADRNQPAQQSDESFRYHPYK